MLLTVVLSLVMMASLFLMLYAAVALIQDKTAPVRFQLAIPSAASAGISARFRRNRMDMHVFFLKNDCILLVLQEKYAILFKTKGTAGCATAWGGGFRPFREQNKKGRT